MEQLGREKIDSILLEGGGTLNWAALEAGVVQKIQAYIAPKLFGGITAKTPVEGRGVEEPDQSPGESDSERKTRGGLCGRGRIFHLSGCPCPAEEACAGADPGAGRGKKITHKNTFWLMKNKMTECSCILFFVCYTTKQSRSFRRKEKSE